MRRIGLLAWLVAVAGCRFDPRGVTVPDAGAFITLDRLPGERADGSAADRPGAPESGSDVSGCGSPFRCSDATHSQVCLGSGLWSPDRACHTSCDSQTGCDAFAASNGVGELMQRGYGTLAMTGDAIEIETTSCSASPPLPAGASTAMLAGGCALVVGELDIHGRLWAHGDKPLIIAASGTVKVEKDGIIDVGGHDAEPGPGGGSGGVRGKAPPGFGDGDGGGCGGGRAGRFDLFKGASGGAGGSFGGEGGGGGGWDGDGSTGALARPICNQSCGGLVKGGSGGGAGVGSVGGTLGGGGGGGLQISALISIDITGTINAGGGGGQADSSTVLGVSGAGGGSGGGVLLESFRVTVDGLVAASGGGGSSGSVLGASSTGANAAGTDASAAGGAGVGIVVEGGAGGDGSDVDTFDGDPGGAVPSAVLPVIHFAGGGGGGAGQICVRVEGGSLGDAQNGHFAPGFISNRDWPTHVEAF